MNNLENTYINLFPLNKEHPDWLKAKIMGAQKTFSKLGIPDRKIESYRKTPIKNFLGESPKKADKPTLNCLNEMYRLTKNENNHTTFINGKIEASLSRTEELKNRMVILPLHEGLKEFSDNIEEVFNKNKSETFLNNFSIANFEKGLFVKVPRKTKIDLWQLFSMTSGEETEIFNPTTNILYIDEGSELTFLEKNLSYFFKKNISLHQWIICLKKGSKLSHIKAQLDNLESTHLSTTQIFIEQDASYNSCILNLGGKFNRTDISCFLQAPGAQARLNGLYALKDEQFSDFHTEVFHQAPNTESDQLYKGLLESKSHGIFNGKIVVAQEAQQTRSSQLNKNLLLSKTAHVDTEPQLLIHADDVKCSHGATTGNLSEDQVFYFQSRGITETKARKMLSHAFANDVFMKIENESLQKNIEKIFYDFYETEVL
jgi:Fe-S cluster assembly protein SufD